MMMKVMVTGIFKSFCYYIDQFQQYSTLNQSFNIFYNCTSYCNNYKKGYSTLTLITSNNKCDFPGTNHTNLVSVLFHLSVFLKVL